MYNFLMLNLVVSEVLPLGFKRLNAGPHVTYIFNVEAQSSF